MEKKPTKRKSRIEDDDIELDDKIDTKPKKKTPKIRQSKSKSKSLTKIKSNKSSNEKEKRKTIQATLDKFHITSTKTVESPNKFPPFPTEGTFKIVTWNINGLRPLLKSEELDILIKQEDPDIFCFNETKVDNKLIDDEKYNTLYSTKYKSYWICPLDKKGYSGVAVFTKYEPISVSYGIQNSSYDDEGRVITLEYEQFYLISCYTPNAGEKLKRLDYRVKEWDVEFFKYINSLKEKKDIILCGDLNVAHQEIDIYEAKGHSKTSGFTKEERNSFTDFLSMGYVDTFRQEHPEEEKFTYFTRRVKQFKGDNKGWRLDYFITNNEHKFDIVASDMLDKDLYDSSDHIPIKFEFSFK